MASVTAVGSAVALSACGPAAPGPQATQASVPPTTPPTLAPTAAPTLAPTVAPTATVVSTLKIGVLLPYTESSIGVDIGLNQKRAADLYLKQHDGKLGGRMVNLVYSAESIEAAINKTKVKTLTDGEHVELLMGGATSDTGQVMRDAAEALKMVYIDTNATANALSRSKNVFRTSASSWQLSEPLGAWASQNGQTEFYVCGVDDSFGAETADGFLAGLAKNGGTASARAMVPGGGDWSKVIGGVLAQPTRNVFAAFYTDDAEGFLTEWDKQGASEAGYKLFGPGALTDEAVLAAVKRAADGVTSAWFWSPDVDSADNKALVDAFPKTYIDDDTGEPVQLSGYAVAMWDAMAALDQVLKQTGGVVSNTEALVAALEGVSFHSPRGAFKFDKATHTPVQDIYIRQVSTSSDGRAANKIVAKIPNVAGPTA